MKRWFWLPLAATLVLTACDKKDGKNAGRDPSASAPAPAAAPSAALGYAATDDGPAAAAIRSWNLPGDSGPASADDAADARGRRLFDGQILRGGGLSLPGGGDAVYAGNYRPSARRAAYTGLKPYAPNDLATSAPPPPLPAASQYPSADQSAARGAGAVLAAFDAFQHKMFSTFAPIISRAGWRARARLGRAEEMTPTHVTVHHTEGPQTMTEAATMKAVRAIQYYHMRGRAAEGKDTWDDIGYHFLIDGAGRVVEGRPAETVGAHARGANENNIGVAVMGNFDKIRPTGAQVESLTRLVSFLAVKYRQDPARQGFLEGHQHYDPTSCPGRNMMAIMGSLRLKVDGETATLLAKLRGARPDQFIAVAAAATPGA